MKKYVLAVLAVVAFASLQGFAATTATLNLTGTVSPTLSVSVAAAPAASTLDLTLDVTDLVVAAVTEKSNMASGYDLWVTSSNKGAFTGVNSDRLGYAFKFGSTSLDLSAAFSPILGNYFEKTTQAGLVSAVSISYSGSAANLFAGTYTDTVTFTIAAK